MTALAAPTTPIAPVELRDRDDSLLARPAPGLAVLAMLPLSDVRLAGRLLRPAPALALVSDPPAPVIAPPAGVLPPLVPDWLPHLERLRAQALQRAIRAAGAAGFEVEAAETLLAGQLQQRLRDLPRRPSLVVCGTRRAGRVRSLARAAEAPVLALPPRATRPVGPAIVAADDAPYCVAALGRALQRDRLLIVGPRTPRRDEARAHAERIGLRVDVVSGTSADAAQTLAGELEGLLVLCDHGTWRTTRTVSERLMARRPVLVVPPKGARR